MSAVILIVISDAAQPQPVMGFQLINGRWLWLDWCSGFNRWSSGQQIRRQGSPLVFPRNAETNARRNGQIVSTDRRKHPQNHRLGSWQSETARSASWVYQSISSMCTVFVSVLYVCLCLTVYMYFYICAWWRINLFIIWFASFLEHCV